VADRTLLAPERANDAGLRSIGRLLRPRPERVVLRPFVPAENGGTKDGRVERIVERVLSLDRVRLEKELKRVLANLASRHANVEDVLRRRFEAQAEAVVAERAVTPDQALLIGAYFAEEYAFEAAALFNPSVVLHFDQSGMPQGCARLIVSLRAVGEGHLSSIAFRTGVFDGEELQIDDPSELTISPDMESLPNGTPSDPGVRLTYPAWNDLSRVVIFPVTRTQRQGVEDLRLTRFTEENGERLYLGTYTAFSGEGIRQELLRTSDFRSFTLSALRGDSSATKGMALFPRRLDGRYAMLGRHDHENIWLLTSDKLHDWQGGQVIVSPRWPWEFIQMGNCGSPIEIDEGWLVITHGVGPIRSYCLGACLLDKRDPSKVLARSSEPLLRPSPATRDGYVPNVAYSCGALVLSGNLLLPYGVADNFTAFATCPVDALLRTLG